MGQIQTETQTIRPNFVACRLDISEFCQPDFVNRCGGKVYLSGFYDDNLDTYICSAEKMIYVHALELVPERYPEDEAEADALTYDLMDGALDDDYFSRREVARIRAANPENFKDVGEVSVDEDEDPADTVREYLQGNPLF